jgi:cytochrome bd-type quinol oxidase subunit 2
MRKTFVRLYLPVSAMLLGAALSGLILSFHYTVDDKRLESDRHLMSAGFFTALALAVGVTGKALEGNK